MSRRKKRTKSSRAAGTPEPASAGAAPAVVAASSASAKEAPPRSAFRFVRENVEALAVAFVLALIIRHFALEAFEIPTGSMAPTLFGLHATKECPNCGTELNIGLRTDGAGRIENNYRRMAVYEGPGALPDCPTMLHVVGSDGRARCSASGERFPVPPSAVRVVMASERPARCPLCEFSFTAVLEEGNLTGGHKIFVTKFAYTISQPQRWDVVVFGFNQWKNYIKRLVGLPGERIDIWDGDVYVNGEIERKSTHPYIQDVLWTKLHDSSIVERRLDGHPLAWRELAPAGSGRSEVPPKNVQWNGPSLRWSLNAKGLGELAVLDYTRSFQNYYDYNLTVDTADHVREVVGDRKVALTVRSTAQGTEPSRGSPPTGEAARFAPSWFACEIRDREFTFQLRVPFGASDPDHPAVIERLVNEPCGPDVSESSPLRDRYPDGPRVTALAAIPHDREVRLEFENVDDRVAARLDGEEILALEYRSLPPGATAANPPPPPDAEIERRSHGLRLIAANAQVEIGSVEVYRDTYYEDLVREREWEGAVLGPDEYFVLGDNSPSSSDGRYWGTVPESHFMGKALVVIWPAWPTNFQMKWIR